MPIYRKNQVMKRTSERELLTAAFLAILLFIILGNGCSVQSKLKSTPEFSPANYLEGHYLYEDNLIVLSARLREADIPGGFQYEFLIINKGTSPLSLNYYNDILTMNYQGKIYSLRKITKMADYPARLGIGESSLTVFQLDGMFSKSVYDIPELIFKLGEKRYFLKRNPGARWEAKETLF